MDVNERIPDEIFDYADELALIDYPVRWAAELKDAFSARWPELLREDAPS